MTIGYNVSLADMSKWSYVPRVSMSLSVLICKSVLKCPSIPKYLLFPFIPCVPLCSSVLIGASATLCPIVPMCVSATMRLIGPRSRSGPKFLGGLSFPTVLMCTSIPI